jgi:hypothetical protein
MVWRLPAVDGSNTGTQYDKNPTHIEAWHPAKGGPCPMVRISQMFDFRNDVTLDAINVPKIIGECDLAAEHFAQLYCGDLVLLVLMWFGVEIKIMNR